MSTRLFDPKPTRKLLVREGQSAWWGVDTSTKRVALGVVLPDGRRFGTVRSIPTLEGAPRLEAIRLATLELCDGAYLSPTSGYAPAPGVIVVEEPAGFGKRPNPELAYAVGAVLCGLAGALPGVRVEFVASSKWKLQVCGYGAIKKPKPGSREPYRVLVWAQGVGMEGTSWDLADAYAIAEFARMNYELEPRGT